MEGVTGSHVGQASWIIGQSRWVGTEELMVVWGGNGEITMGRALYIGDK